MDLSAIWTGVYVTKSNIFIAKRVNYVSCLPSLSGSKRLIGARTFVLLRGRMRMLHLDCELGLGSKTHAWLLTVEVKPCVSILAPML